MAKYYPGIQIVIAYGRNVNETIRALLSYLYNSSTEIGDEFQLNVSVDELVYGNGSRIKMIPCDDPDNIRGWEAHVIWLLMDTFSGMDSQNMREIETRLRMSLRANRPPYATRWITSHAETD